MRHVSRHIALLFSAVALALEQPAAAEQRQIFLLAGQSNMEGVGLVAEAPTNLFARAGVLLYHSPNVRSSLPANRWNPLSAAGISPAHFGPEIGLACRLSEAFTNRPPAFIKHARGGTKLTVEPLPYKTTTGWHPGESPSDTAAFGAEFTLFVQTVTNALAALRAQGDEPVLSGLFWVQGEADSTSATAGAAYGTNLAHFIRRVREQFAAPDLPFVCAQILPYQKRPGSASVRQALADIDQASGKPTAMRGVFMIPTEGLCTHHDAVHFNTQGQILLGERLAECMIGRGLGLSSRKNTECSAADK